MTTLHRASAGLVGSAALALGLLCAPAPYANAASEVVKFQNGQTGKCLTIAGGRSTENNVVALQFNCDSDPSRTWALDRWADGTYQLKNVQTGKCLTIAGGRSTENNVEALQFDCDSDPSRRWLLIKTADGTFKVKNVQTRKCLTIAGGVSTENNVHALQFDCDGHPSRTWSLIWPSPGQPSPGQRIDDNQ